MVERQGILTNMPKAPVTDYLSDFDTAYADMDPYVCVGDIDGDEPEPALRAIGLLHRYLDEVEDEWVLKARVEDRPWSYIATLLGRSKQTVWEKHRDPSETVSS